MKKDLHELLGLDKEQEIEENEDVKVDIIFDPKAAANLKLVLEIRDKGDKEVSCT